MSTFTMKMLTFSKYVVFSFLLFRVVESESKTRRNFGKLASFDKMSMPDSNSATLNCKLQKSKFYMNEKKPDIFVVKVNMHILGTDQNWN